MTKEDILRFLNSTKNTMAENREYLIQLDSVAGDGDLGLTMGDGFSAAYETVKDTDETDIGKILYMAGKAMGRTVPSTMGTLMSSGLIQAGKTLKGREVLESAEASIIFEAYEMGVQNLGKAKPGEKTFLDGLHPAVVMLKQSLGQGENLKYASDKAAQAAEEGFRKATEMVAVHGRAATRGAKSKGIEDPGAAVAMLLMRAFADSFS